MTAYGKIPIHHLLVCPDQTWVCLTVKGTRTSLTVKGTIRFLSHQAKLADPVVVATLSELLSASGIPRITKSCRYV
jgi:hypothetical protein